MNKHMIILPLLLTSAVCLHVLSYYLEEPDELAQNPVPVASGSIVPSSPVSASVSIAPSNVSSPSPVVDNNLKSAKPVETVIPVKSSKPVASASAPLPVKTAAPQVVKTVEPAKTPEPVVQESPAPEETVEKTETKVASALIPTKNFLDIVREAKIIGGRLDPFLSMKPPEMEKLPEMPEIVTSPPPITEEQPYFPDNKVKRQPGKKPADKTAKKEVSPPPSKWVPTFDNGKSPDKNKKPVDKIANKDTKLTPGKTPVTQESPSEGITFDIDEDITKDLILTGIITGNKPTAIISVDSESKPFGIGELIRKEKKIKLVSINFVTNDITISNGLKKVKLKLKEE